MSERGSGHALRTAVTVALLLVAVAVAWKIRDAGMLPGDGLYFGYEPDVFYDHYGWEDPYGDPLGEDAAPIELPVVEEGSFSIQPEDIPAYAGEPWVAVNGNVPFFRDSEKTDVSFESYTELDDLRRCGTAFASVGLDIMPREERGSIGSVKPTGWQTVTYDIVDGRYLYNRCHLIGYQLTGENANRENLITGTRYLNIVGMLPFENMVADFVKETEYHVLYRVTPVFSGEELLCRGVLMEAESVEDEGDGILFCVYCYNVQPGIEIDYRTGESRLADTGETVTLILNLRSRKYHLPDCPHAAEIAEGSRQEYTGTLADLEAQGYVPCLGCFGEG